ncbi:MAG: ATP12 family chaperone protein [Phyllobacterium sp.]
MRELLENLDTSEGLPNPDPVRRAQIKSKLPLPKRFYKAATAVPLDNQNGFTVHLDGRAVRTPARNLLTLPTLEAAEIIAAEFNSQEKEIDPATMPATRLANTAIDGIAADPQVVFEDVLRFASSDMLFYRADAPQELVMRQTAQWDPVIDWASSKLGARFILAEGVMHVEQPREALAAFGVHLSAFDDPLVLAALHTITSLTGSALLALAVAKEEVAADDAWSIAHLDEDWTIEHWGEDVESSARRALRKTEMLAAAAVLKACQNDRK